MDDEPAYLAAQDGSFELARCRVRDRGDQTCTQQDAVATAVIWHPSHAAARTHYPYAVIGDQNLANYTVSADILPSRHGAAAGLIGRFECRRAVPDTGEFDGYLFNVSATGRWQLVRNANPLSRDHATAACPPGPATRRTLATGTLGHSLPLHAWTRLSLSMSGGSITVAVDGKAIRKVTDTTWPRGAAGIEAGAFTASWPRVQYSHLAITPAPVK
jgi:hypothetical protein